MHSHPVINGGHLMLNDDFSESMGQKPSTPEALGGTPLALHLQVTDANAAWTKAVAAGAEVVFPLKDQFWGDCYGQLRDPFGHQWSIGQTIAKPSSQELEQGSRKSFARAEEHAHA
jgi:PhnB protein